VTRSSALSERRIVSLPLRHGRSLNCQVVGFDSIYTDLKKSDLVMKREEIPVAELAFPIVGILDERWMLLTAGESSDSGFNVMTVSWGSIGRIWHKPFVMVVVRPSRYTYRFLENSSSFTVSVFPPEYKDKLLLCGTKSGRDIDKIQACGFTIMPSTKVEAPGFDQAELILECRKVYFDDLNPKQFLADYIEGFYDGSDYHRMYFGEILAVRGTSHYRGS